MRFRMYALLFLLALSGVAFGQAEKASPPAAEADQKRFDALRTEGFQALYNLDYESARRSFKELARLYPEHPAGPQLLAAGLWLKTLNESRRLQASLYNSKSFYAKTEEKVDPKIIAEFRELTQQAKQLAEARLKRDPRDVDALYYLGASEGLKAAFEGAVQRSFMSALRNGSDSVGHHRKLLKLDPDYHDAEVTIGMYDYVVGSLPLPVKLLAAIGGYRGSKKRGLQTLERVAREGKWASDDAKVLLIALLKREGRFTDALTYTRELAAKYPRNYLFKLETAGALVSQAAVERPTNSAAAAAAESEASGIFESLLRDRSIRSLDQIHFQYAEALFVSGQLDRAAKEFLAAATLSGAEPGLATMARLRAAQSLDLAGRRNDALIQYKAVLARPNVYDVHDEAKRGLREPYRKSAAVGSEVEASESGKASGEENDD